jgi:hypothetical protein
LETDRMVLSHVGSHDKDCICVRKVLLGSGSTATPE